MGRKKYDVLPGKELAEKYGLSLENREIRRIKPEEVPQHLVDLIPLTEFWGIGDDYLRDKLVTEAPSEMLSELIKSVVPRLGEIDSWLEQVRGKGLPAYYQFLDLEQAADMAGAILRRREGTATRKIPRAKKVRPE